MSGKRRLQKEETRNRIREAAKTAFIAHGFDATTSRQIASAAGVAVGTLFVHFPNKQAMLIDILYEDIEGVVASAFQTLPKEESTIEQLLHLASNLYAYYLRQPELSRALLQHTIFASQADTGFDAQIGTFVGAVTHIIEQGQTAGQVVQGKAAHHLASVFMSAYFFVLIGFLRDRLPSQERALSQLRELTTVILT